MIFPKKYLKAALTALGKSVELKDKTQYISHVFGRVNEAGVFVLCTSSFEQYSEIPANVEGGVAFDCNYAELKSFAYRAKGDNIHITPSPGEVTVSDGHTQATLPSVGVNPSELELFTCSFAGETVDIKVPIPAHVYNAIGKRHEMYRDALNGVFIDFPNGKIVSSDERRLAFADAPHLDRDGIIVPKEGLFKGKDIHITKISGDKIEFLSGDVRIRTSLIKSKFVDYHRLLPLNFKGAISFDGDAMRNIVKVMGHQVELYFTKGAVSIKEKPITEHGEIREKILPCNFDPDVSFSIILNPRYLADAIMNKTETIFLNNSAEPVKIAQTILQPMAYKDNKGTPYPDDPSGGGRFNTKEASLNTLPFEEQRNIIKDGGDLYSLMCA